MRSKVSLSCAWTFLAGHEMESKAVCSGDQFYSLHWRMIRHLAEYFVGCIVMAGIRKERKKGVYCVTGTCMTYMFSPAFMIAQQNVVNCLRQRHTSQLVFNISYLGDLTTWIFLRMVRVRPVPKGRLGTSDVWDLKAVSWFHFTAYCCSTSIALSVFFFFFCPLAYSPDFSRNFFRIFMKRHAFWYGSCLAARRW